MAKAKPMPIGNATAMPAISIAATKSIFARLKITPPRNAERRFDEFA